MLLHVLASLFATWKKFTTPPPNSQFGMCFGGVGGLFGVIVL